MQHRPIDSVCPKCHVTMGQGCGRDGEIECAADGKRYNAHTERVEAALGPLAVGSADGLADTLRAAMVLLHVGSVSVLLTRGDMHDRVRLDLINAGSFCHVERFCWASPGEWARPSPFEGFSIEEVLAMDWKIVP